MEKMGKRNARLRNQKRAQKCFFYLDQDKKIGKIKNRLLKILGNTRIVYTYKLTNVDIENI